MFNEAEKLIIENGLKCPECDIQGAKVSLTTTLACALSWEDENHNTHTHDSNHVTGSCTCKNGHNFNIRLLNSCWCGWVQESGIGDIAYQNFKEK